MESEGAGQRTHDQEGQDSDVQGDDEDVGRDTPAFCGGRCVTKRGGGELNA